MLSRRNGIALVAMVLALLSEGQVIAASSGVGGGGRSSPPPPAPRAAPAPAPRAAPAPAPRVQAPAPQAAPAAPSRQAQATPSAPPPKVAVDAGVAGGARQGAGVVGVQAQSQMARQAERQRALAAGVAAGAIMHERDTAQARQNQSSGVTQPPHGQQDGTATAATPSSQYRDYRPSSEYYPDYRDRYRRQPDVVVIDNSPRVIVRQPPVAYDSGTTPSPSGNPDWQAREMTAPTKNNDGSAGTFLLVIICLLVIAAASYTCYHYYNYRQSVKNRRGAHSLS